MTERSLKEIFEITAMESPEQSQLLYDIYHYFHVRSLKVPTMEEALYWAQTENGEMFEQLLLRNPGWIRNHPEKHDAEYTEQKLMEEMADQVFMLLVAGAVSGYDLLELIQNKMQAKLRELNVA